MEHVIGGSFISCGAISNKIDEYIMKTGDNPNYIVMSHSTASMLEAATSNIISHSAERYAEFHGVPVAICDRLRIGEFEIV